MDEIDTQLARLTRIWGNPAHRSTMLPYLGANTCGDVVDLLTSKLAALEDENKTLREAMQQARNLLVNVPFDRENIIWATAVTDQLEAALSKPAASIKDNNHD